MTCVARARAVRALCKVPGTGTHEISDDVGSRIDLAALHDRHVQG
jgi:hypothetical protein